jgi:hypothetical protein
LWFSNNPKKIKYRNIINMNSNLLKEAIADAKAVRATALANAKAALEEAFNNRFSAVFADKLREDSLSGETSIETPVAESAEKDKVGATKPSKSDGTKSWSSDNGDPSAKPTAKNITPNTVPSAKDGGDGTKGWSKDNKGNAFDGTPKGVKENTTETVEEESVEEAVTNEDLDEIIRELEAEAGSDPGADSPVPTPGGDIGADAGDPEAPETPEEDSQEIKSGDTVVISKVEAPAAGAGAEPPVGEPSGGPDLGGPDAGAPEPESPAPMEEEEIDLNELLASLNEEAKEECDEKEDEKEEKEDKKENVDEILSKLNEAIAERNEAYKTVQYLKQQINEINLLNAKLLYTNKLFKEFGMNRDQKTKVVEAFDLTKNVREVKMTFANWCESLSLGGNLKRKQTIQQSPTSQVTTITEGVASKPVASTKPAQIITENYDDQARRFQKLAGINVKK